MWIQIIHAITSLHTHFVDDVANEMCVSGRICDDALQANCVSCSLDECCVSNFPSDWIPAIYYWRAIDRCDDGAAHKRHNCRWNEPTEKEIISKKRDWFFFFVGSLRMCPCHRYRFINKQNSLALALVIIFIFIYDCLLCTLLLALRRSCCCCAQFRQMKSKTVCGRLCACHALLFHSRLPNILQQIKWLWSSWGITNK